MRPPSLLLLRFDTSCFWYLMLQSLGKNAVPSSDGQESEDGDEDD